MVAHFKLTKKYKLALLLFSMPFFGFSQSNTQKQVQRVFDQLITVYGSAKSIPQLQLVKKGKLPIPAAQYISAAPATIKVDEAFYKICQTFGKDSLNVLAIVLSHELTHYYNDHTFCRDYGYVNFKKVNPKLKNALGSASSNAIKDKETEADIKGFFFAAAAGYQPFGLQGQMIEKIYQEYHLNAIQENYPSKKERIDIAKSAEKTANELYENFKKGLVALENKQYDEAITYFNNANGKILFRENLNNIGVAKTLKARELKTPTKEEFDFPERFQYPLEIDNASRLQKEQTRGLEDISEIFEQLLKEAKKNFEEAIRLDPSYTKGYVNVACVYDLLGNPEAAIGKIKELPINAQKERDAQRVLAIAYYNADNEKKAEDIWKELKM